MSELHDELKDVFRPLVEEIVRTMDQKITTATAPLIARIEDLEREVAALRTGRPANG